MMQKTETFVVDYNTKTADRTYDYGATAEHPADLYRYGRLANGVDGFANVTAAAIDCFHEQGYLVVENAFSRDAVQDALEGLLYLLSGQHPTFTGVMYEKKAQGIPVEQLATEARQDYVRKFMWFVEHEARLKAMAEDPQLLDLVTRLIGESPALFQDMALLKPPRIGREKPWHQDHAYFDLPLTATVVGVWIALDEATTENGCMVIYPGSHRQGPVVHFNRRDWQICDTYDRFNGACAVPLKPGGALFFHSLLHHGTPANVSTQRRRAVQFHYAPASAQKTSKEERLTIFGEEGKDVTC
jgi:phytanoyl-CoA hydroxylase